MSRGERLDRWLAQLTDLSRQSVRYAVKDGRVEINGERASRVDQRIIAGDMVKLDGEQIINSGPRYFMLHKPAGYLCSNQDSEHLLVAELMPDERDAFDLQIAGRLDLDTTGLVLLTDDGAWNHRLTAPSRQCKKTYRVSLAEPLDAEACQTLETGVLLHGEKKLTQPATVERTEDDCIVRMTISEGRYHQVKRMMAAVGHRVASLHREQIGGIVLDPALAPGEYRRLTAEEITLV
jgi:16S rRNA pseudouridine516 synthase